jgi:serine/threonine protein kinase/Tol biopolymer transport system component
LQPRELQPGTVIADYRIESQLGRGGQGVVYLAEHVHLGRKVAFKVLPPELADDDGFRRRFIREARLAASLDHPNILDVYDAGEADGRLFLAVRLVRGSDLGAVISREGPLDLARTLRIVEAVGDALDTAHEAGLVHRDVKPGNILIDPPEGRRTEEAIYLGDFGLTKPVLATQAVGATGPLTATGYFVGTPDYCAPEQIQGHELDGRADVYSLGCVLYQCLAGEVPFPRDSIASAIVAHMTEPPPKASLRRRNLPPEIDDVISRALAKSPAERFQTCQDLGAALAGVVAPGTRARARTDAASQPPLIHAPPPPDVPGPEAPKPAGPEDDDASGLGDGMSRPFQEEPTTPSRAVPAPPPVADRSVPTVLARGTPAPPGDEPSPDGPDARSSPPEGGPGPAAHGVTDAGDDLLPERKRLRELEREAGAQKDSRRRRRPLLIGAVVLAALAVGAAVFALAGGGSSHRAGPTPTAVRHTPAIRRQTSGPGTTPSSGPTAQAIRGLSPWSPHGSVAPLTDYELVVTINRGPGQLDLGVVAVGQHTPRSIVSEPGVEDNAALSPDRRHIAFERSTGSGSPEGIWIVAVDGSDLQQVAAGNFVGPAWAPDGRHLAAVHGRSLVTVDLTAGTGTTIVRGEEPDSPAWSPDGSTIAYVVGRGTTFQIALVGPDGTGRRLLADGTGDSFDPAWSPDGSEIAFGRFVRGAGEDVFVVPASGGSPTDVTFFQGDQTEPSWAPDGRSIAYTSDHNTIAVADPERSKHFEVLVDTPQLNEQPCWSTC